MLKHPAHMYAFKKLLYRIQGATVLQYRGNKTFFNLFSIKFKYFKICLRYEYEFNIFFFVSHPVLIIIILIVARIYKVQNFINYLLLTACSYFLHLFFSFFFLLFSLFLSLSFCYKQRRREYLSILCT